MEHLWSAQAAKEEIKKLSDLDPFSTCSQRFAGVECK